MRVPVVDFIKEITEKIAVLLPIESALKNFPDLLFGLEFVHRLFRL